MKQITGQRIPQLDGLRAGAILLVLVQHYAVFTIETTPGSWFAYAMRGLSLGWSGVDLFFVLSGFLIGGILIDQQGAENFLPIFYLRRFCRIVPIYAVWLALFVLLAALLRLNLSTHWLFRDALPLWSYATFTQNFVMAQRATFGSVWIGITWSLAVEEQFYVVAALLFWLVRPERLWRPLIAVALAAPFLRIALFFANGEQGLLCYVLMPCRADALLVGVLCAYAVRNQRIVDWLRAHRWWLYLGAAVLCVAAESLVLHKQGFNSFLILSYGYSLLAVLYGVILLIAVLDGDSRFGLFLSHPILGWLSRISYGVYIFHQGINGLLHSLLLGQEPRIADGRDAVVTVVALAVTLVLATLSWNYFERPITQFGQARPYRKRVAATTPVAAIANT
jgi:peptidoglycan/LPS O-acetylase OafA/YrhL